MKFSQFITLIFSLLVIANAEVASTPDAQKTNDKPNVNLRQICQICHCNNDTKILDCSSANVRTMFNADEWNLLTASNVTFETIHFEKNNIKSIPVFPEMAVQRLFLSYNEIDTIERAAFQNLKKLKHLDLFHNMLTSKSLASAAFEGKYSPTFYEPIESLKSLDLGHNLLHSLQSNVFEHFPNLESLTLASNTFKIIDQVTESAIGMLSNLKYLDLSYMELASLPDYILHTPQDLETLNLTGNLFTSIPPSLSYATNLKYLSLDENPLKDIEGDNVFPPMKKLTTLSLSYISPMVAIGKGGLSNLEGLKQFTATNNPHLRYIHPNAFCQNHDNDKLIEDYPPIDKLYLHSNNLSSLDEHLLSRWDRLVVLDIRANPWACDCENKFMIEELYPLILESTPTLSRDLFCAWPPEMNGTTFDELNKKKTHLRCVDKYGNHPSQDGAILIGMLIGLLVAIPLSFAMILIYKRGCFGFMGKPGPGDYSRAFYKRAELREDFQI